MELSKKTYIKGENSPDKLANLMKIADELYRGNWSKMVLDALIKVHDLDSETCARRGKHNKSQGTK